MKASKDGLKRGLSLLLAVMMCVSLLSVGAFAVEPDTESETAQTSSSVAEEAVASTTEDAADSSEDVQTDEIVNADESEEANEPAEEAEENGIAVASNTDNTREAIYLGVPTDVEDGVYYATINLKNASNPTQYSMGNTALRGSDSYKAKQTSDTAYRPIVIVKDGKATALLEFMPMGYLGEYGFMMELEGVYPGSFTQFCMPNESDPNTVFTSTRTLTYQKTTDGKTVYDIYNNPDSEYKFDGTTEKTKRPAGFGKAESYVNIVDQPYSHLLALDVTPVMAGGTGDEVPTKAADYTADQAAYCHVFVPVMFAISTSSGDQYARMQVDWTSLTKIDNPETNVQYMLYQASQTSTEGYSEASVTAFNTAYKAVHDKLENIWPKQTLDLDGTSFTAQPVLNMVTYSEEEQQAMAKQLKDAIDGLSVTDFTGLQSVLDEAKAIDSVLYTAASYQKLVEAMDAAETMIAAGSAAQNEVDAQAQALRNAIDALESVSKENGWDGVTIKEPADVSETSVTITSAEELAWLAQQVNSGRSFACVFLNEDIDLNGKPWTAIGTKSNPFTGEFYGNGHTVSNLLVTASSQYQGLFGYVGNTSGTKTAIVQDLSVQGTIKTTASDVGGVVGYAVYAKLNNLKSDVTITIDRVNNTDTIAYAGGIVGEAIRTNLNRCFNNGDVTALDQEKVGGVAGYASSGNIQYCGNTGNITAGGCSAGIAGLFSASGVVASVINCYNTGDVVSTGTFVGGIVGSVTVFSRNGAAGMGVLSQLYNRGDVTAQSTVGGLAGGIVGGELTSLSASYSTGKVAETVTSATSSAGALVGRLYSGQINYAYALEGTADQLNTLGTQTGTTTMIVSNVEFESEDWFKSDDFFTALGGFADDFAKDTEALNDGYPVLTFQNDDVLAAAKLEAINELNLYKDISGYKGLSKTAAEKVKTDAFTAIQNAATKAELAEVLAKAKSDLDAIPNDANYGLDLTELEAKLAEAKELESKGDTLYTQDSWNSFTATIAGIDYLLENGFGTQEKVDTYLGYLKTNQAALVYKDADYTAVDEALASVPTNLSDYTDESAKAVTDAVAAVVRGKNITEQTEVEAMAERIRNAVAGLTKKDSGDEDTLDWNNLADGVYSLEFTMVKMNRTDLSMSNDAVNHTAKLEVKDGQYNLTVNFKGLHYLNRFGYLAKLSYYEDGYTYGKYGAVSGTLLPATVLATQKNSDGTDVTDEFNIAGGVAEGQLYPLTVTFPVVNTAKADADGLIPLHVFVPVMEDIAAGNGDQDVLMKLDKTTLKKVDSDDPSFDPEEPEELSPAVDLTDEATGVKLHADKGVYPKGVKLVVSEIKTGDSYSAASKSMTDVGKKFKLYDVKVVDADGNAVDANGTVNVNFPVPDGYNADKCAVYRMNDDGTKTLVKGTVADGYFTVTVKSLGQYVLVEKGSTTTDAENAKNTKSPKTGDSAPVALVIVCMTAAVCGAGVLTINNKRKHTGD